MRSIRISLILLILVLGFAVWNCLYLQKHLTELTSLTQALRANGDFSGQEETVEKIGKEWDRYFPYMTYVASYQELNRADEAMQDLLAAQKTESRENAAAARARLLDALRRIKELEGVSFRAVF